MKNSENRSEMAIGAYMPGFYFSILATVMTVLTFAIAIATPPLSGPFCTGSCFEYPYTDIADRFPRDYYWMYPAILLSFVYLIMIICVAFVSPERKKVNGLIGVVFACMSTLVLSTDYFLQISVIPTSMALGESEGLALLTQFNPHGIFIVLEEIGYIFMILSFFSLAPIFSGKPSLEKSIWWTTIISFVLMVLAFTLLSIQYGTQREYRFEVYVITIAWMELIVISILLARYFSKLKSSGFAVDPS